MTHEYFIWKARTVLSAADGDPEVAGPLADWAEAAKAVGDRRVGVIVAEDGRLLAETRFSGGPVGAHYVRSTVVEEVRRYVVKLEVGLALGQIGKAAGMQVIHVRYSEVCEGPGKDAIPAADGVWTTADVASRLGIQQGTVRAYAARGEMPAPDGQFGRTPWWWGATIRTWRPR